MAKIYFLIPVFNEEENMPDLLASLTKTSQLLSGFECHFTLLDDGSQDGTVAMATSLAESQKINLKVLSNSQNEGPGVAFRMGFEYVSNVINDGDLVVTMEGDNTSRCELLKLMIERMHREDYDIVLASPYAYGGGFSQTSLLRVILSHGANGLTKIFLNIHGIHTFSSFFRVFSAKSLYALEKTYGKEIITFKGFECMVELLAKSVHLKLSITEVPMSVDWSRRKGKSKMKIMRTIKGYFKLFLSAQKIIFIQ